MLTGCAILAPLTRTPEIDPARVACESFEVIEYSRLHDTVETIVQVQGHNAAYEALCGNKPVTERASP